MFISKNANSSPSIRTFPHLPESGQESGSCRHLQDAAGEGRMLPASSCRIPHVPAAAGYPARFRQLRATQEGSQLRLGT